MRKLAVTVCMISLVVTAPSAKASTITQYSLNQISFGQSFNIGGYGQLDWVIVGVNEKASRSAISTTGTSNATTLISATPGGVSLDFNTANYPYFVYSDGASPSASAPPPGDHAGYQYDKPAVDVFLPAGPTRLTVWLAAGFVGDASYLAELADGTSTGAVSYWAGDATFYQLQLDILSDTSQQLRFSVDHPPIGDPFNNNAGIFAIAASPVPLPASIFLIAPGLVGLFALGKRRPKEVYQST